ncbi:MAG: hypothetical protein RR359_04785 [Bacilli bacterium]
MKKVYIVLTYTGTLLSALIKKFTKQEYSHASLSLDDTYDKMYSFGRKYPRNPIIGVFKEENIHDGLYKIKKNSKMAIYELEVTNKQFKFIKKSIKLIKQDNNGYNFIGLLFAAFNIKLKRNKKYYCSEFIFKVLSDKKVKVYKARKGIVKPYDLIKLDDIKMSLVYEGLISLYKGVKDAKKYKKMD